MSSGSYLLLFIIGLIFWSTFIKGLSLWKSARLGQKKWFIALMIFNTAGILEFIYLFLNRKRTPSPASTPTKSIPTSDSL